MCIRDSVYIDELGKYYVRFIEEYQKAGIPIYAMTLQNEPLLEIDYPSCYITGGQEAKLAKAIKQELAKSKVLNEMCIRDRKEVLKLILIMLLMLKD